VGGFNHALALADDGEIIVTGSNKSVEVNRVLQTEHIVDVASGGAQHQKLALSSSGQVYSWGNNNNGELGHGDTESREIPTLVHALDGIYVKQIFAGGHSHGFSAAVTSSGDVWMWGHNGARQLGLSDSTDHKTPQQVPLKNVKTIATGGQHTLFLLGMQ
jgi:alpha-tubulin suppressor-like RCC1 family protein